MACAGEKADFRQAITPYLLPLTGFPQERIGVFVRLKPAFPHQFPGFIVPDRRHFSSTDNRAKPRFSLISQ